MIKFSRCGSGLIRNFKIVNFMLSSFFHLFRLSLGIKFIVFPLREMEIMAMEREQKLRVEEAKEKKINFQDAYIREDEWREEGKNCRQPFFSSFFVPLFPPHETLLSA